MKRVMLLPSPPASGSIGSAVKCLGIAKELRDLGCRICFVIGGKLKGFLEKNGFYVYDYPVPLTDGSMVPIRNALDFIRWTGMGEETYLQESIRAELAAIEDFHPDVIFSETRPSASISARLMGIPTVMVAGWPLNPHFPGNAVDPYGITDRYNKMLQFYGLEKVSSVTELFYEYADQRIAPTIPLLEPELEGTDTEYLGLVSDLKKTEELPDWYRKWEKKPQIFIYLSVGALRPDLYFKIIIDIFKDTPYRVLCSCGFHYLVRELPRDLPNIKFVRHISVPAIIDDTFFIIFHGGQDMMLTALSHGIPSITIPGQHFERAYNASMLERLGVSKKIMLQGFRKSRILSEMDALMGPETRRACDQYSKIAGSFGGTARCAEIICGMAK